MGQLKEHMMEYMTVRGYSPKTIKAYTSAVSAMAVHFDRNPLSLSSSEVETYFLSLRRSRLADASIHLALHAVRFFYRIHKAQTTVPRIRFPGKSHRLPNILSRGEVSSLLAACRDLKSKTVFHLIYSCGLRISEAVNLKVQDINFERKTVFVRRGKGKKDRYTLLGDRMAQLLRDYLLVYAPTDQLFTSGKDNRSLSTDSIQRRFRQLVAQLGFPKTVRVHTLRHCFATHLLENGTNIFHIMRLLGHSSIQTTMLYLHLQSTDGMGIQSPLDTLPAPNPTREQQIQMFELSA